MTGRLIGKRGWVDQGQDRLALLLDRAVSGGVPFGWPRRGHRRNRGPPPPTGAAWVCGDRGQPQARAGLLQVRPRPCRRRQLAHMTPSLPVDQASARSAMRGRFFRASSRYVPAGTCSIWEKIDGQFLRQSTFPRQSISWLVMRLRIAILTSLAPPAYPAQQSPRQIAGAA